MAESNVVLSSVRSAVVIISTVLIVFTAARNTFTWHLQQFWGASANFWQSKWDNFLDVVGDDPYTLWAYGPLVLSIPFYWLMSIVYILLDVFNTPSFLMKYKIQPGVNEPVDKQKLLKAVAVVLFNQLITLPYGHLIYKAMTWRTYPDIHVLPAFHWVLFELAVFIIVQEILFYYIHRLFHHKFLYKYTHKLHHEWTAPISIIAIYNHPIEHLLCNIAPLYCGIFLMGSHVATGYLWCVLAVFFTLHTHSSYHIPFFPSPEFHDYHHLKFNQNFGVVGILDRIHGTDTQFRNSPEFKRHTLTLNLVPARAMYPDQKA